MNNLFYKVAGDTTNPDKYYLSANGDGPDTEISQWQFDQLATLQEDATAANSVSANPAQASSDIAAQHAAQDPASDNFQGDPATVGTITPAESTQVASAPVEDTPHVVSGTDPIVDPAATPQDDTAQPVDPAAVPADPSPATAPDDTALVAETPAPVDPAVVQPAPAHLTTKTEIDAWFVQEEARVQAFLEAQKTDLEAEEGTTPTPAA